MTNREWENEPDELSWDYVIDGETYKNIDFVKAECEDLAQQLHKAKPSLINRRKGKTA